MGSNGIGYLSKELLEGFDSKQKKYLKKIINDELVIIDSKSQDEMFELACFKEAVNWKENLRQKSSEVSSSLRRGFDHFITKPVGTERNRFIADHEIMFSRSMTEKSGSPKPDRILDRLSKREKQNLTVNLVKIQNDGKVEVDIEKSAPVASELLELQSFGASIVSGNFISESKKPVPRLQIVILVVGTRRNVQPFLAIAKRLQEYGHHIRPATHANFATFVKSPGVDFYPLGGDPRVLAEYVVRNKGLIPSGPTEISIQRKHLKAIIGSLLPACTAPDLETGVPLVFLSELRLLLPMLLHMDMHMLLESLGCPFTSS